MVRYFINKIVLNLYFYLFELTQKSRLLRYIVENK